MTRLATNIDNPTNLASEHHFPETDWQKLPGEAFQLPAQLETTGSHRLIIDGKPVVQ